MKLVVVVLMMVALRCCSAKIIFIVMSEKSDFWVDEFPNKVILALIVMIMKHLKMKKSFQLTKICK